MLGLPPASWLPAGKDDLSHGGAGNSFGIGAVKQGAKDIKVIFLGR